MSHSVYVILYFFFVFLVFFSAITIFVQENSFTIHLLAKMAIHTIDTLGIFHFGQEKRGAGTRVPIRREKKFHFVCMWLRSTWLSLAGVRAFYLSLTHNLISWLTWLPAPFQLQNQIERNFDTTEMPKAYQFSIIEYLCKISTQQ